MAVPVVSDVPGEVKVMLVPVRKPLTSTSAFSGDPAQPENSVVSLLDGTVAVAGWEAVVLVVVWVAVCARARELANSVLTIHKFSFSWSSPGQFKPNAFSVWVIISTAVAESMNNPPSRRAATRMRVVLGVSDSSSTSMSRSPTRARIRSPSSIFSVVFGLMSMRLKAVSTALRTRGKGPVNVR